MIKSIIFTFRTKGLKPQHHAPKHNIAERQYDANSHHTNWYLPAGTRGKTK